jgi:hypothetical protein
MLFGGDLNYGTGATRDGAKSSLGNSVIVPKKGLENDRIIAKMRAVPVHYGDHYILSFLMLLY